jgi:hypothetical protein
VTVPKLFCLSGGASPSVYSGLHMGTGKDIMRAAILLRASSPWEGVPRRGRLGGSTLSSARQQLSVCL